MLKRRQQILAKIEDTDGTPVTPTGSDAVLVYDPETSDDVAFLDRTPAGTTLSRVNAPPGLTTRTNTFKVDLRGSGAVATAPEWGKFLRSCAHKEGNLYRITLTGIGAGEGVQVGELVYQTSTANRGICLTDLRGADGNILVWLLSGAFTVAAGFVGESGGASASVSAVDITDEGWGYVPDSLTQVQWNSGAWAPGTPSAIGVVLSITRGGFVVGALQVIELGSGSSWVAGIKGAMLWGNLLNGDVLSDGTNSATLTATPSQVRTPAMTIWNNLDGLRRITAGARGDFTLEGASGEPLQFSFSMRGSASSHAAALPTVVAGLGTIRAPRLFGAFCGLGYGAQFYRMPVKSVQLSPGNTIADRLDGNATGGTLGTAITDRDPSITIEVDNVGTAFDWLTRRNSEQNVRFGLVLGGNGAGTWAGRTVGNTLVVAAPNCQVTDVQDGDADGFASYSVTLKPRSTLGEGDDEYVIAMF